MEVYIYLYYILALIIIFGVPLFLINLVLFGTAKKWRNSGRKGWEFLRIGSLALTALLIVFFYNFYNFFEMAIQYIFLRLLLN